MIASTDFSGSVNPAPAHPPAVPAARNKAPSREALYDAELVRRFLGGDESAFVEIIARHREKMFAVAFSLLRNRADAEEIVQDTFIRAHGGLVRFRGDSALATWLHRIALNLSRNRYWYFRRRGQHSTRSFECAFSDDNHATLASLIASSAPDPLQAAATKEFLELIDTCMDRIGPGHRDILVQRNILHRSYDEISQTLGIRIGTVKSRIARAREQLRVLLASEFPECATDSSPSEWFRPARPGGHLEAICA